MDRLKRLFVDQIAGWLLVLGFLLAFFLLYGPIADWAYKH